MAPRAWGQLQNRRENKVEKRHFDIFCTRQRANLGPKNTRQLSFHGRKWRVATGNFKPSGLFLFFKNRNSNSRFMLHLINWLKSSLQALAIIKTIILFVSFSGQFRQALEDSEQPGWSSRDHEARKGKFV